MLRGKLQQGSGDSTVAVLACDENIHNVAVVGLLEWFGHDASDFPTVPTTAGRNDEMITCPERLTVEDPIFRIGSVAAASLAKQAESTRYHCEHGVSRKPYHLASK
ncbi:TPA: hypothetical protein ACUNF5_007260 [Burkholderia orbicola]|uniref:hypothetical protein n=1 Tax=Burkholderia orbicola TaxID=2978683 RepID=UPI000F5AE3B3|nr:hypothetical protein [Burkholderia orbicola]MDN7535606.1 hypothetical protein [Burkholderia orbicola]